ncbi:conjugal transfer nickase/helicase TraI [Escherichia coli]|nr:conjugal transfer nickase/helicase TraI [Escherichia coli]
MTETGCGDSVVKDGVKGSGDAQFVALQGSRNGESLLADNMQDGVRIARDNPDSGVVVRIAGEGSSVESGAITGGRAWGISRITASSRGPEMANRSRQRYWHSGRLKRPSAVKRNAAADEIVRKMAENKPDLPDGKTELAVRDIAGQERDRSAISEREPHCRRVCCVNHNGSGKRSGRLPGKICLQERLQQMERDMVRDLQKEKTLGGD